MQRYRMAWGIVEENKAEQKTRKFQAGVQLSLSIGRQYSDGNIAQSNLQIQGNFYQNSNVHPTSSYFFFVKIEKLFLKLIRNHKGSPERQNNLKGNKPGGLGLADIKTYCKFKQCGTDKDRHIDNGIG